MKTYTVYIQDPDHPDEVEEIDLQASNLKDAKEKAKIIMEEEYVSGLKIVEITERFGSYFY